MPPSQSTRPLVMNRERGVPEHYDRVPQPAPPERQPHSLPEITLWFCGSCGCYDRSQDHAPECDPLKRTPRKPVVYVPRGGSNVR